jgi:tetratricopeptide (TPR) repeat protein
LIIIGGGCAVKSRYEAGFVLRAAWLAVAGFVVTGAGAFGALGDDPPAAAAIARNAVAAAAPVLPAAVIDAMQEGRYEVAGRLLATLAEKTKSTDDKAYFSYLGGISERLGGHRDAARALLQKAIEIDPKSRWTIKIRYEIAGIELASGNWAPAEELARAEAERLLSGERKDLLAGIYHDYAKRLLQPGDPLIAPDPNAAYELLVQARELAESPAVRASLLFAMGRASMAAGNAPRALENYGLYIQENPAGADRLAARFGLGETQQMTNQPLLARRSWADLAREIERMAPNGLTNEASAIRADALYAIRLTYGVPGPPDDTSLNQGVAALRRFLAAFPSHPKAIRAAHEIGLSYLARGKSNEGLEAFMQFLKREPGQRDSAEARRDWAELAMDASFKVGAILQGQQKFAEAIAAWKGYLAQFPNGPQSADAQRAVLDTQLMIAADHLSNGRRTEARAAWTDFVAQNPLDARVPELLFQIGESFATEKKYDQAIAALESLAGKFPASQSAAHAQFMTASLYENELGKPADAIDRFRKIAKEPWHAHAQQRIAVMEGKSLVVITPRTFRSGETATLKISTRNIETLHFTAYKLNALSYFRKKSGLERVESLDIGLVAPDAAWTAPVPGYARYKPSAADFELKKLELPGVYVVKVTDEKTLQATTLVLGSDLDAVVKSSRDQLLVFAQDMKTGQGRKGVRVLVSEGGQIVLDATTGADGVLLRDWTPPRAGNGRLTYLLMDGPHVAGSWLGVPEKAAQGLTARAYIYTDRPAYRPGHRVAIRGVVREVALGQYSPMPKAVYQFEVADSRGRLIAARAVTLSDFGTFHETLALDSAAPVGTYRIRAFQPGKSDFSGSFEVHSYQLEPISLAFDLKKTVFYRGETIQATLVAKYQYGAPVAGRPVEVQLPDGRVLHGTTDAAGQFPIEFPTEGFAEEQSLALVARLPQDNVATGASVILAIQGFHISLKTTRTIYLDGESFEVQVDTADAQGKPIGQALSAAIVKLIESGGRITERETARKPVTTDPKTGHAALAFQIGDRDGGRYVVRVAGTDRFGNPIVADKPLTISGKKDETKLRMLADRQRYKVGEEASVNLHSRDRAGTALLTWEADRILTYKIVRLNEGNNTVAWAVDGAQFPNFTLTATRMARNELDQARLDVQVERDLKVGISVAKPSVGPGDPVEIDVTTVDQLGRPVAAELSVAVVDQSLLRLYNDALPEIGPFFFGQTRTGAFATEATNTFRYAPVTTAVASALVEERERLAAQFADEIDRKGYVNKLGEQDASYAMARPWVGQAPGAPAAIPPSPADAEGKEVAKNEASLGILREQRDKLERGATTSSGGRARRMRSGGQSFGKAVAGKPVGGAKAKMLAGGEEAGESATGEGMVDGLPFLGKGYQALNTRVRNGLANAFAFQEADADAIRAQEPQSRERFVETAYWNPRVVTGKDGKARVSFKAPSALSEYRITARGVTGADTLAGQAAANLTVRKSFFVDLKVPASLTQGDKPRFVGQVHHTGVTGKLAISLTVYAGGREEVFPKTIELSKDGVEEVVFEPFEIPEAESVRLSLKGTIGGESDEIGLEVPVSPWGVEAVASESGTAGESTTVFIGLPAGRTYENPEMLIVVSPSLERMLIEMAVGEDVFPMLGNSTQNAARRICYPPPFTTADRAAELLAATSALQYLRSTRAAGAAPEAQRLSQRIQALEAALVSSQNQDGGWPWVSAESTPRLGQNAPVVPPSDRLASAAVVWALASTEPLGLLTDKKVLDLAVGFLSGEFAKLSRNDHETRAAVLHALGTRRAASFEAANSLNRVRNSLSDPALAYLALTFANLDRATLANEVIGMLSPRAKIEATAPGRPGRVYWDSAQKSQAVRGAIETTALVSLAYARVRPQATELEGAVAYLTAHRTGTGWRPAKAKGPALAALASYYAHAQLAEDRYKLTVTVNDTKLAELNVAGATPGQAIPVPLKAVKVGGSNRIRFDMEGRGRFGYAVTLQGFTRDFGPDQKGANRVAVVSRRVYLPAAPELDGKVLPTGFGVAVNAEPFDNIASQVALGGKARVLITAHRNIPASTPEWERDFLIVEEHLPAGTTLIEGSVSTNATSFDLADGVLTLYFAPNQNPGAISYDVFGYLPGQYRALPTSIKSAYEPGRFHLGSTSELRVRGAGEPGTDPYKATPDELFARGKAQFDAGRFALAGEALEPLFGGYTLRDDIAKDAARMLLLINIKEEQPRNIVTYFEVVKEKAPELILTFNQLLAIGKAYREIKEYERAMIVWRGLIEASYLEDARVGELLRQRGKTLEAIDYLVNLWRSYPNTASIESDFFGLSQLVAKTASEALGNPGLRHELANAGVTRSQLLSQSIRMIEVFLACSPRNPVADEASLALVGAYIDLEDFKSVDKHSARFAKLYPKSSFLDSFQYADALANFHLGQYDRAVEVAQAIANATYKDAAGADQPSPNKWQAVYILGQIYDARRQPGKALEYYKQVADRFGDAAGAIHAYTRKDLKVPEVSIVRPSGGPAVALGPAGENPGRGFRVIDVVGATARAPEPPAKPGIGLDFRNIAQVDVKVYPVDLMQLYLTRRNLNGISGIDLAGITPLVEKAVTLGSGADYDDQSRTIELPLTKEGAYLAMIRGESLYASGIVLVSPLEIETLEDPAGGRVRITLRDARTKNLLPKVEVKVIGSDNPQFISGTTDLRGVFVAEGVRGMVTAVARKGDLEYAFYRGSTYLGPREATGKSIEMKNQAGQAPGADAPNQALDSNLRLQNESNNTKQLNRLQQRYNQPAEMRKGAPAGGFR